MKAQALISVTDSSGARAVRRQDKLVAKELSYYQVH